MKKLILIFLIALTFAACYGAATMQLKPGLTAPGIVDGARLDAAALLSTNATATATVSAVYELPVYGEVEVVTTNTAYYYVTVTNTVVETNLTQEVTDIYTIVTNSGVVATNYYAVATNSYPVKVNTPSITMITNMLLDVTGSVFITNSLVSLTADGGYAETNRVDRWIYPGARLLVDGEAVTLILTR